MLFSRRRPIPTTDPRLARVRCRTFCDHARSSRRLFLPRSLPLWVPLLCCCEAVDGASVRQLPSHKSCCGRFSDESWSCKVFVFFSFSWKVLTLHCCDVLEDVAAILSFRRFFSKKCLSLKKFKISYASKENGFCQSMIISFSRKGANNIHPKLCYQFNQVLTPVTLYQILRFVRSSPVQYRRLQTFFSAKQI